MITFVFPALVSILLVIPFIIMEVVNRRQYNEDFPVMLFVILWLNLFVISSLLLPILRAWRAGRLAGVNPALAPTRSLFVNPRRAALVSMAILLVPALFALLVMLGWVPVQTLLNGPNPAKPYVLGQVIAILSFTIPLFAGLSAAGPVARTLRAGGSLLAHPVNVLIVTLIVIAVAIGVSRLIIDQWPCFTGVPLCD